jgi:hypothetical protein
LTRAPGQSEVQGAFQVVLPWPKLIGWCGSIRARMKWESLKNEMTAIISIAALALSGLSFYVSYLYKNQRLELTITDVSYATNRGEVYMTVAFSNGGNRDAALLRADAALWSKKDDKGKPQWLSIDTKVSPDVPLTDPKIPLIVKAGGVEVVRLSAKLTHDDAERALVEKEGGAFLGIVVATMNSDGNLYSVEHPVARLDIDSTGRIRGATAAIHQSLEGFKSVTGTPPGDQLQENEKTPFVWADQRN